MQVDRVDIIQPVNNLDFDKLRDIMTSSKITKNQKIQFLNDNHSEIKSIIDGKISSSDFKMIMENRHLELLRPLKNRYTRLGDRRILAMALGIKPYEVNGYIRNLTHKIHSMKDLKSLHIPKDVYDEVRTYVFRHGTKSQVINFLDYELHHTKDILKSVYSTLEYNSGGVADYFLYPVHRLDNSTVLKVFDKIHTNLQDNASKGNITNVQAMDTAEWAIAKIYRIQNNQHLKNTIKLKKELE